MKARSAKAKGRRFEKDIEERFKSIGWECRAQPGSGIYKGFPKDLWIKKNDMTFIGECKARKEAPRTLERWMEGADLLFIKPDRGEPRVYMPWSTFERIGLWTK